MEKIEKTKRIQHLAGIVPVAGQPLDFKMPWEDSLMPISPNYLAVERAVYQCALAGCETIWIVGHKGTQPLLRKRVGDIIVDPNSLIPTPGGFKNIKEISIYYVPVHPRDRDKRDSLGWSVLYGADSAFRISKFISKWIAPEKFFCSFPYGILDEDSVDKNRKLLSSTENVVFLSKGLSVKDNLHLPFTFGADDFFKCRDMVKHRQAREWGDNRHGKHYDLSMVFQGLDISNSHQIETAWFHDISSWEKYKNYMSSQECGIYSRPDTLFKGLHRKKKNRIL
jgi:hypothetical protein